MEQIKILRERTGAGMVDCKKALEESGGDMEKAIEILRKKGIAKAAKREERETNEGIVKVGTDESGKAAFIIEINAETDFVSRNEKFGQFATDVFNILKASRPKDLEALMAEKMADGNSVKDNLDSLSGIIGEKLGIKRFDILTTNGTAASYSHANGRIGAIAAIDKEEASELAYEIAMQVAAASPRFISREEVSAGEIDKEKEIYTEQLKKEGKPEEMIEKIMQGKLNKFYEEICLIDQEYIKEDKKKIRDILNGANVEKFIRYSL